MNVASFAAIFVSEMLIGRYVSDGANASAATNLLQTFQSGPILGPVMVGAVAFFLGVGALAVPLILNGGPLRWPALAFVAGALLIGGEIITAQVLLSQIGDEGMALRRATTRSRCGRVTRREPGRLDLGDAPCLPASA